MSKSLENLKKAIKSLDEVNLFGDSDSLSIDLACVEYLREKGYKIVEPFSYKFSKARLKKSSDLIELFYKLRQWYHPDYLNKYRRNTAADQMIAKRFVESRMEADNLSKEEALLECAEIINTIFEFEADFKFEFSLDFGIFGQDALKWVTEKAISILNHRDKLRAKRVHEKLHKKLEDMYDSEDDAEIGYKNLSTLAQKIEKENLNNG
jgi:hypothetical protein